MVRRTDLEEHVWPDGGEALSNSLEVIVSRLRKKIDAGASGRLLHTVPSVGYLLSAERRASLPDTEA